MSDLQRAKDCAAKMYASDRASKSLGIEIEIPEAGSAVASMYVRQEMVNGFDICHGGIVYTLADTAFAFACNAYDEVTVAGGGNIEFLRPATRGEHLRALRSRCIAAASTASTKLKSGIRMTSWSRCSRGDLSVAARRYWTSGKVIQN